MVVRVNFFFNWPAYDLSELSCKVRRPVHLRPLHRALAGLLRRDRGLHPSAPPRRFLAPQLRLVEPRRWPHGRAVNCFASPTLVYTENPYTYTGRTAGAE
jgi:hypothetical protein